MRILVFISGFGSPHITEKLEILEHNLKIIHQTKPNEAIIDVWIAQYDDSFQIPNHYSGYVNGKMTVFYEKGFVGDFFQTIATPERVKDYSYIFCCLDDVLLYNVNLSTMIQIKEMWNLNILSPSLDPFGKFLYTYMLQCEIPNLLLKITSKCEYFCYLMDYDSYCRYHTFFHKDNPYMWGMDCIITKHMKLRVGLVNTMAMRHYYIHESYSDLEKPRQALKDYLERYNESLEIVLERNVIRQLIYSYE